MGGWGLWPYLSILVGGQQCVVFFIAIVNNLYFNTTRIAENIKRSGPECSAVRRKVKLSLTNN